MTAALQEDVVQLGVALRTAPACVDRPGVQP